VPAAACFQDGGVGAATWRVKARSLQGSTPQRTVHVVLLILVVLLLPLPLLSWPPSVAASLREPQPPQRVSSPSELGNRPLTN
jgi:hypothetical protein